MRAPSECSRAKTSLRARARHRAPAISAERALIVGRKDGAGAGSHVWV